MQEITPGIYTEDRFGPYNLGLITLDNGGLIIDAPPRAADVRQWITEAQEVVGTLRYVVLTGFHPDRILGAALSKLPMIATEATARQLAALDEKSWHEMLQAAHERHKESFETLVGNHPPKVHLAFEHHLRLHHRSPALEIEAIAGAAPGSLWLIVPDQKLLFTGDSVVTDAPPVVEYTPDSQAWLKTLAMLARRTSVQKIAQGRGTPVVMHGDIESQREFMRVIRHTARTLSRETPPGTGVARATQELQQAFFPALPRHSEAVQRIQRGLDHLIAELLAPHDEGESDESEEE